MSPGHIRRVNKMYREGGLDGLRAHAHITSPHLPRQPVPVPRWGRAMALLINLVFIVIMLTSIQHMY